MSSFKRRLSTFKRVPIVTYNSVVCYLEVLNNVETALALAIGSFILASASFVLFLYFFFRYKDDFAGITQLSSALEVAFKDEDTSEMIYSSIDSFHSLGTLAQNANAIMTDEETLDALMTSFAGRVRKSMMGAVMGTASGDVKKLAHAERVLNTAMINGAKKMSPEFALLMNVSGLDVELEENPELFGYIMKIAEKNGLLNMFSGQIAKQPSATQQEMVHEKLGIEF